MGTDFATPAEAVADAREARVRCTDLAVEVDRVHRLLSAATAANHLIEKFSAAFVAAGVPDGDG